MRNHVTPEQLAKSAALDEQTVLRFCIERSIPIYRGRVDRSLFNAELKQMKGRGQAAA